MKIEDVVASILVLAFAGMCIALCILLYFQAKDSGACEALGGVYVNNVCIDASAVIELTKGKE